MEGGPVGFDKTAMALLRPGVGERPRLKHRIGRLFQRRPAQAGRREALERRSSLLTPSRRAISRIGTPPTDFIRRGAGIPANSVDERLALDVTQGNRAKKSTPNETCQVVVVPTGNLAADAQGIFLSGRF